MKIIWWILNVCWIALFSALATVIYTRHADARGVIQTPELRLTSLMIVGILAVIIFIGQLIFLHIINKSAHT
ncbi:DUF3923 family protein [Kurthia huakuii]|uniref:DUF3923 family protein n=1 Tax=Kurthia huakuii TaxID=1421019 RepID=UPI000496EB14|nr:DUF3923 family protein [Kurthia huakuii]MBM7699821.1 uncharacterized protein HemY [Kurthia huakuii]